MGQEDDVSNCSNDPLLLLTLAPDKESVTQVTQRTLNHVPVLSSEAVLKDHVTTGLPVKAADKESLVKEEDEGRIASPVISMSADPVLLPVQRSKYTPYLKSGIPRPSGDSGSISIMSSNSRSKKRGSIESDGHEWTRVSSHHPSIRQSSSSNGRRDSLTAIVSPSLAAGGETTTMPLTHSPAAMTATAVAAAAVPVVAPPEACSHWGGKRLTTRKASSSSGNIIQNTCSLDSQEDDEGDRSAGAADARIATNDGWKGSQSWIRDPVHHRIVNLHGTESRRDSTLRRPSVRF